MTTTNKISELYNNAKNQGLTEAKAFLHVKKLIEVVYNEEGLSELINTLSAISEFTFKKAKDCELFSAKLIAIIAKEGDYIEADLAIFFEECVYKFPNSLKLIQTLADIYGALINQNGDEIYVKKLDKLTKENPTLINIALQQCYSLMYSHDKLDVVAYKKAVGKIKEFYIQFFKREFAIVYVNSLKYLSLKEEEEPIHEIILSLKLVSEEWKEPTIVNHLLDTMSFLTRKLDKKGCAEIILEMENMWDNWIYNPNILAKHLAYTLSNYSLCVEGDEKQNVLNRITELSEYWIPAKDMAIELENGTYLYAHKPQRAK